MDRQADRQKGSHIDRHTDIKIDREGHTWISVSRNEK